MNAFEDKAFSDAVKATGRKRRSSAPSNGDRPHVRTVQALRTVTTSCTRPTLSAGGPRSPTARPSSAWPHAGAVPTTALVSRDRAVPGLGVTTGRAGPRRHLLVLQRGPASTPTSWGWPRRRGSPPQLQERTRWRAGWPGRCALSPARAGAWDVAGLPRPCPWHHLHARRPRTPGGFGAAFDPQPSFFLLGGVLIGAGVGAVFKGTTGIVLQTAAPENRLAMTSALLVVLYVGLSIPVVGAGIALNQGASIPNTVVGFAILVALGVTLSGWVLLTGAQRPATKGDQPRP